MSMGNFVEVYVCLKKSEEEMGECVAHFSTRGEEWTETTVLKALARAKIFAMEFGSAVEKHGAENLCVRGNT